MGVKRQESPLMTEFNPIIKMEIKGLSEQHQKTRNASPYVRPLRPALQFLLFLHTFHN